MAKTKGIISKQANKGILAADMVFSANRQDHHSASNRAVVETKPATPHSTASSIRAIPLSTPMSCEV